jgi:hypothetical protein
MDIKELIEHFTQGAAEVTSKTTEAQHQMSPALREKAARRRAQERFDRVGLPRMEWERIG